VHEGFRSQQKIEVPARKFHHHLSLVGDKSQTAYVRLASMALGDGCRGSSRGNPREGPRGEPAPPSAPPGVPISQKSAPPLRGALEPPAESQPGEPANHWIVSALPSRARGLPGYSPLILKGLLAGCPSKLTEFGNTRYQKNVSPQQRKPLGEGGRDVPCARRSLGREEGNCNRQNPKPFIVAQ
jgi:hypothetical protein